jgi:hypothetical protein
VSVRRKGALQDTPSRPIRLLLANVGECPWASGRVDVLDLLILLQSWGP